MTESGGTPSTRHLTILLEWRPGQNLGKLPISTGGKLLVQERPRCLSDPTRHLLSQNPELLLPSALCDEMSAFYITFHVNEVVEIVKYFLAAREHHI